MCRRSAIRRSATVRDGLAISPGMVDAGAAHFDGVGISVLWSLPFAGLLLSIALLPLLTPHFWEHHFCKVAAFWVLAFFVPCAVAAGFSIAAQAVLHIFLLDYVPFIVVHALRCCRRDQGERQSCRYPGHEYGDAGLRHSIGELPRHARRLDGADPP